MLEWLEYDQYNQEAKLYELIGEEVMNTHVKEMLDEILNEYDARDPMILEIVS